MMFTDELCRILFNPLTCDKGRLHDSTSYNQQKRHENTNTWLCYISYVFTFFFFFLYRTALLSFSGRAVGCRNFYLYSERGNRPTCPPPLLNRGEHLIMALFFPPLHLSRVL